MSDDTYDEKTGEYVLTDPRYPSLVAKHKVKKQAKDMLDAMINDQKWLNDIWDSFDSSNPSPIARRITNDSAEQSMSVDTENGEVLVSRKPGEIWHPMPSVGGKSDYQ